MRICSFPSSIVSEAWLMLSGALHTESALMQSRISPESLEQVYRDGFAVVAMDDEEIVGFLAAWPVNDQCCEIGSAWVRPDMRAHGIGRALYCALKDLPLLRTRLGFGITMNPISVRAGRHAGMILHQDWHHPVPWHLTCGPCDYLPDAEKPSCKMRNTSCWLRLLLPRILP